MAVEPETVCIPFTVPGIGIVFCRVGVDDASGSLFRRIFRKIEFSGRRNDLLNFFRQVLESCVPVTRLTLAIRYCSCTSFSYVLLRLKGFIPTVTPAPEIRKLERKGVLGFTDDTRDYSDGVEGIVQMLRGENPSRVLDDVHKAVDELNNETLPEGTRIHPFMDRTDLVNTTLHTVSHTLFEGIVLVVFILILFLGSWRGALLVALTIPLSLLIAFILMHVTNIPANLLSLGAIDFGILVDGAIVMMETVLKKRERHPDEVLTEDSILRRTTEVARPIFFSTLIIITAYLPLFAFEHIEKKLFTPMAYTVGYALLGALCVALFLIPGLAFYAYRKPGKIYHNRWLEKLSTAYHAQIVRLMEKPRWVIVPLLAILLGAGILSYTVGKDFLPPLDEGAIWIQVQLPPGISIEKSKGMGAELRKTLKEFKEVSYVMTQVGRDDEGAEAFSLSHVECGVGLKPYSTSN